MKWQPIETAPKDGTRIIVAQIGLVHDVGGHMVGTEEWKKIIFEDEPALTKVLWVVGSRWSDLCRKGNPCWHDGLDKLIPPTHWMPLPEPPE